LEGRVGRGNTEKRTRKKCGVAAKWHGTGLYVWGKKRNTCSEAPSVELTRRDPKPQGADLADGPKIQWAGKKKGSKANKVVSAGRLVMRGRADRETRGDPPGGVPVNAGERGEECPVARTQIKVVKKKKDKPFSNLKNDAPCNVLRNWVKNWGRRGKL